MEIKRAHHTLGAALLLAGSGEILDFLLPLFAGQKLHASPLEISLLLAIELLVSLAARPIAGSLADRWERKFLAALGATIFAASCGIYACTATIGIAYLAAVVGGAGGALMWVALRAIIGERLSEDSAAFARLFAAEEAGSWMVFVPIIFLFGLLGYNLSFVLIAACCLAGAIVLLLAPPRPTDALPLRGEPNRLLRRLLPMLAAVTIVMMGESLVGLLLLYRLQFHFGLEPVAVALVFLPGAVAMSVLPTVLHGWVLRLGRVRMLRIASVASAVFALSLAVAPTPEIVAFCWILAGTAWAVVLPIQQSVMTEISGSSHLGRGLGWYESAGLLGGVLGTLLAGLTYETVHWSYACLIGAIVIASGTIVVPAAMRAVGASNTPADTPPRSIGIFAGMSTTSDPDRPSPTTEQSHQKSVARQVRGFAIHTVVLAVALIGAATVFSTDLGRIFIFPTWPESGNFGDWLRSFIGPDQRVLTTFRIWGIIWILDGLDTVDKLRRRRSS